MCGFKWVLTNHGIAEWAVGWKGWRGEALGWGALQWSQNARGSVLYGHSPYIVYLLCFCLSIVSLSLRSAALSALDPGWRHRQREGETNCQLRNGNYSHNMKTWWTYKLNYVPSVCSECRGASALTVAQVNDLWARFTQMNPTDCSLYDIHSVFYSIVSKKLRLVAHHHHIASLWKS